MDWTVLSCAIVPLGLRRPMTAEGGCTSARLGSNIWKSSCGCGRADLSDCEIEIGGNERTGIVF